MSSDKLPKVYLPQEAAEVLRVSVDDLVKAIKNGEIEAFSIAGQWRITEEALMKVTATDVLPSPVRGDRSDGGLGRQIRRAGLGVPTMVAGAARPKSKDIDPREVAQAKEWAWEK